MNVSRRQFVVGAGLGATGAALELSGCARPRVNAAAAPGLPTLREAGAAHGILVGGAVVAARLRDTPVYAALVKQQASLIVAENEMKFGRIHPERGRYFFGDADYLLKFADENRIKLRGHNFVWHRSLPKWFETDVTAGNAESVLVEHIETVGGRYAGKLHSWDVVNEAIQVQDGLAGGMRDSPWQKVLPGYLDIAYKTARRVDPKAMLVYNDYGIEGEDGGSAKKRAAVLAMLRGMQERGVPVDALGVQSHIGAGSKNAFGPEHAYGPGLRAMIAEVRGMGLKVLLTELDVNDRNLPADVPARDAAVAATYEGYLRETLADPAVVALLTWGFSDRNTWLNSESGRVDKLPERCLPFDEDYKAKPAFEAEVKALQGAHGG